MLPLVPALIAMAALVSQVIAQQNFPYCGTGAWSSLSNVDTGGIKLTAYNDKTLHVTGVCDVREAYFVSFSCRA